MCHIAHYWDYHCGHRWATITLPCYPGAGFDTCPEFINGRMKPLPPRLVAREEKCPKCDLGNNYNRNRTRMVKRIEYGFRWGVGPDETDPGCDIDTVKTAAGS
ncbi:hypothetical protein VTH82DRAFT_2582 [Thermothelomyces myriococcoides]